MLLFRVLRREARESRFAARGEESSVPIFGRDAELALLLQAWEKARSGRGQAVLLTGEAGIGKSRLLQAFAEATAAGLPTRHVFQCSPLHTDNPFWPVVLRSAPAAAIVARGTEDAGGGGRRKVRRNVVVALAAQLLAAAMPALLIFEDAQWADQATLELMRHLAGAVGDAPVLLIVTDRPEAEAHLGMATNLTRLELARLDGPTSVGLITAVAGRCQLAPRLLGDIVARSDGIPLFLEEMTRAVLEAAPADGEIAVPATLRDSLIARLDVAPARAG